MTRTLLDAGPLVAYFSERDQWHKWSIERMRQLTPPLWTCEPVLTEACFLIARNGGKASDVVRRIGTSKRPGANSTTTTRRWCETSRARPA